MHLRGCMGRRPGVNREYPSPAVRVKENATLASIEASAPRLPGRTGAVCDEAFDRAHGAILFVRSPD